MGVEKITDVQLCKRKVELVEELATEPYKVNVSIKNWSSKTYLINLPAIKKKSTYLSAHTKPRKDCDYIIFNEENNEVFLIELKSSQRSKRPAEIEEQLNCASRWWEHLAFCMGIDTSETIIKKIVIFVNSKMRNSKRGSLDKLSTYDYYTGHGENIILHFN